MYFIFESVVSTQANNEDRTELPVFEENATGNIRIWPNPTSDVVNLAATNGTEIRGLLQLRDALGRTVFSQKFELGADDELQIDLEKYAAGQYWMVFTNEKGQVITKKIIRN